MDAPDFGRDLQRGLPVSSLAAMPPDRGQALGARCRPDEDVRFMNGHEFIRIFCARARSKESLARSALFISEGDFLKLMKK
ncbi:hypothetical protein ACEPUU_01915 [Burkholderia thailandensis]|uniref:hypothetical protein n=1 Tax=Burkholderia thailandensis TaxID=57975 RepID=UPI00195A1463|nr:hypothetical protein [Burkholderia thailandensis]MCS6423679.1 hypothetical protein [Burkholderia thailandensis]